MATIIPKRVSKKSRKDATGPKRPLPPAETAATGPGKDDLTETLRRIQNPRARGWMTGGKPLRRPAKTIFGQPIAPSRRNWATHW
jgi:hypothetical protein